MDMSIPLNDNKTYKIAITTPVLDEDGNQVITNGVPQVEAVDTTGWLVFFNVKRTISDPDEDSIIAITLDFTGDEDDPLNGIAYLNLGPPDTSNKPDTYRYNMRAVDERNVKQSSTVANFVITDVVNIDGSQGVS